MSAAEVLAQHYFHPAMLRCKCMENRSAFEPAMSAEEHASHQLDALKAAGYAVVELPEPQVTSGWKSFPCYGNGVHVPPSGPGSDRVVDESQKHARITPELARKHAAALLAAANAAEVTQ